MSDHPDYFGQPQFPHFGKFKEHRRLITSLADGTRDYVFLLEANARIYSLWLEITGAENAPEGIDIITRIDGHQLATKTVEDLFEMYTGQFGGYQFGFSRYDPLAGVFNLTSSINITFTDSYHLEIDNDTNQTIFFDGGIYYSDVI